MQRVRVASDALRTSFFFLPAIAVVVGFFGARLLVGVEVGDWVGRSTVDSARAVLSTTAAATITFASITFSVSLLIMQQGSSQFSPRVIHGLVRDPFNRRVIAIVVGTFTYCLVSLQRVRGPVAEGGEEVVPELAVAVGLLLGVVAVLAVVAAINHTSRKMDVSVILGDIVAEATGAPTSPDTGGKPHEPTTPNRSIPDGEAVTVVRFDSDGWVRQIDRRGLLGLVGAGGIVRLEIDAGRYAIRSTPVCTIWPAVAEARVEEVSRSARHCLRLGPTRTMSEDVGFGVRQLVDVALRALSPGVNDPTTAQDAIFHLGTVLVDRLSSSPVPTAFHDDNDRCLLAPHTLTDEDMAELAFAELRRAGASQPAVAVYLLQTIALVADAARANDAGDRIAPFLLQARLVLANVDAADLIDDDRARVRQTYRSLFDTPGDARSSADGATRRLRGGAASSPA